MIYTTIIDCCFEENHASFEDAVAYINSYCCYQPDTVFSIVDEDGFEVGFGVFINEVVLEDGNVIYKPDWIIGDTGPEL